MKRFPRWAHVLLALALLVSLLAPLAPAKAAPWYGRNEFASIKFLNLWRRSDDREVRTDRSLYWGFVPWYDSHEFYRESPNGLRLVQYFDKARMEINAVTNQEVTNGLLVVELVSGQLKLGEQGYDNAPRSPAQVPVAGDGPLTNPNSPTYASFSGVATVNNGYRDPDRRGQSVGDVIDKGGNRSTNETLLNTYREQTKLVTYNTVTGHNIAAVFWDFLNRTGPIIVNGERTTGPIVDWVSAMGYPISDPYWVRARVGGVEKDVLVQLFERRILTYTPTNDAAYQVEMGNVGQHYFQWRYPHLGPIWTNAIPAMPPVTFASKRGGSPEWDVYAMESDGSNQRMFGTNALAETVPYSWLRSADRSLMALYGDSRRGDGTHRQLWRTNMDGTMTRISYTDGTAPPPGTPYQGYVPGPSNDWNPAVSPDGTKLLFVSDRTGAAQLYLSKIDGGNPVQLTSNDCYNMAPSWAPGGRVIYWEAKCGDQPSHIYRAELRYMNDAPVDTSVGLYAELTNQVNLTRNVNADNRLPRVSPDGAWLAFTSNRDGNYEIYRMRADGTEVFRLTQSSGDDMAPSWDFSGTLILFDSNRDGNWNVYLMETSGAGQRQLTTDPADDRWSLWAQ